MKIAFTTTGENLDAPIDARFGRALRFLIYDTDDNDFTIINNSQNLNAPHGAGIQSAETIVKTGAQILITGNLGPKAFRVLKNAQIKIFTTQDATIHDALENYAKGVLNEMNEVTS